MKFDFGKKLEKNLKQKRPDFRKYQVFFLKSTVFFHLSQSKTRQSFDF